MAKRRRKGLSGLLKPIILTEIPDIIDNLGRVYIIILFLSGAIWSYIALQNIQDAEVFRISMIYAILLILAFIGIVVDKLGLDLGLDSRLWDGSNIKQKVAFGFFFSIVWYFFFIRPGYKLAVAQSFLDAPTLAIGGSQGMRIFMVSVLGPLAENAFFFAVLGFTFTRIIRLVQKNRTATLTLAAGVFLSTPFFSNVPFSGILVPAAAVLIVLPILSRNPLIRAYAPLLATALYLGGTIFPKYHSGVYQLNERNFLAASLFGIIAVIFASFFGILVVEILHIVNNFLAVII